MGCNAFDGQFMDSLFEIPRPDHSIRSARNDPSEWLSRLHGKTEEL
jgi:hypothetical protein